MVKINIWFFLVLLGCLLWVSAAASEITEKTLPDAFTDVISKLSSIGDRSTGTAGNQAAALYIKEKFEQLGYENVGILPVFYTGHATCTKYANPSKPQ